MRKAVCIVAFVAFFALVSCDDGVKRDYWENGKLKSELRYENEKLNGECVWYSQTGQKLLTVNYKDDVKEGPMMRWHVNGTVEEEGWFKNNHLDSVFRSYSDNGTMTVEGYYVDGKLDGEIKKWYDNGQVFQEGQYVDGMMDGSWYIFYPSGAMAGKAEYDKGKGKQIGYDESGYKCLEVQYLDNKKHGKEIHYNPIGEIVEIIEYENGEVVGEGRNQQESDQ